MKRLFSFLLIFLGICLIFGCKIVKHDSQSRNKDKSIDIFFSDSGFDPDAYVESIWEEQVIPYISNKAINISDLLNELKSSREATSKKYGYRVGDEGSFYNFSIKGRVKILRVNLESRNGLAYADVAPYDEQEDLVIQIGPVLKGSAIRDSLDFISLNSFENQVEYAKLASSLNIKVRDSVLGNLNLEELVYKEFDIVAVFKDENPSALPVLMPVIFSHEGL